ncbi:hypothetical protein GCM10009777_11360 [Microbacterium pumilum]|uniref:Uncharacterized protein n=1 Tax=Microbacterium pumilum TaxID=344165 RepID=A0ABP5DG24_9MICO
MIPRVRGLLTVGKSPTVSGDSATSHNRIADRAEPAQIVDEPIIHSALKASSGDNYPAVQARTRGHVGSDKFRWPRQ